MIPTSTPQAAPPPAVSPDWKLPTEQQFAIFLKQNLMPAIAACEQERRGVVGRLWTVGIVVVALAALACALIVASGVSPVGIVFALAAGGGLFAWGYKFLISGYRQHFKFNVVQPIVRFFGPDFDYEPSNCITEGDFSRCRIFDHSIDRYNGEDLVSGIAGKTRFAFSEVHAEYKTTTADSKGRRQTQWHTIFKGLFFIGDFSKHFNGTTLVLPDVAESALGWLGQKLQSLNFTRPGELVKLEDPEFEKLFVVYGTDQVEARYLLSPSLMRRLVEFRRTAQREVYVSFVDECVFVAVNPNHDLLEPSVFSPLSYEVCHRVYADLAFALGIIEELNLNTRIWTKL